ncbi:YiiD C-terminal domain-containing protein [Tsukamurella sp. 8F]|uniref:DUF4442 domain-containing protein n=1 Tax=unclassified Tsukamurella TaxID=2633480 RepID=UPI0023B99E49|nr:MULTISPECIES: DUF4442 domain-containing protein [unclassified Tsukamurella]MDF0529499.1 YiiD C-terminal domain-containing protein [Tsukamurella sp. 8J]MDF0585813.1 YiiD C-terminal domain-containing protein [Tsukamurella sp. 8F]
MTTHISSTPSEGRVLTDFAAAFPELDHAAPDYGYLRSVAQDLVPFGRLVGTEVTEIGADRAVVTLGASGGVVNHMGTVHAGALFTAADIAGALAFVGAAAPRLFAVERLVLRASTVTYRRPATGTVRAVAVVDERELRELLGDTAGGRHDLTAKAVVLDGDDVVTSKFVFDYVCDVVGAPESGR